MFKCECGFKLNHEPKQPFYCKCGRKYRGPGAAETPADIRPVIERQRAHWHELHTKDKPTQEWFDDWVKRIPSIGCDCRKGVLGFIATYEFDFSSRETFFPGGVDLHNFVNKKLEKSIMSLEEARARWSYPTTDERGGG